MVNSLSSDNTSEIKEPSQQNIIFSKQNKKDNYNGKTIKGPHGKSCRCIFSFPKFYLWLTKMVNYLSSDNTSEIKEPSQQNIILSKQNKKDNYNGKTIKGLHGKPCCCIFFFSKIATFGWKKWLIT